jgi:hypothetical protein
MNFVEIFCLLCRPSDAVEQGELGADLSPAGNPLRPILPCPRHTKGRCVYP